ncbi:MAG: XRE family transcriptional regulator [Alteromonadaceae bacterium]|uniref:RodZ domain-containing protein n=1 Tax=Paraglaciecola chathamensis TaxID=368405 RepID=UPI000C67FD2B|nr:RodZ domain-containing protein [Paraglaciecola agarilytica]MBN28073.1 XRE family transcriptional regulator [Alteromonadaceae bacterium]|tara:strand:+ start:14899 stop:15948 length:1050 start_codon:yes stop_codon:yes gene_type:complete
MSEEVQHVEEPQVQGPGPVLKAARIEKGLTVEQIANRIHLKPSLVSALEEDVYDQGISMTFIKGYLKLYARQVDVSEAQVLDGLDNLDTHKKEPAKLQSFSRRVAHQANDDKLMLVTYLILAVVVALVVIWWFQQSDNDKVDILDTPATQTDTSGFTQEEVSSTDELELDEFASRDIAENQVDVSGSLPSNEVEQAVGDVSTDALVSTQPEIDTQTAGESVSNDDDSNLDSTVESRLNSAVNNSIDTNAQYTSNAGNSLREEAAAKLGEPVDVVFTFADDCWVSVIDATGETIAIGVKVAGRVMSISGIAPFEIILGAPSVVQIKYADKDVDMSFLAPNSTAKFSLPRA